MWHIPVNRSLLSVTLAILVSLVACAPAATPTPTSAPAKAAEPTKAPAAAPAGASTPTAAPKAEATAAPKPKAEATARPLTKVKAGMNMSASNTPFYVGIERGYYKEYGLDVELINIGTGNDTIPPLATGELLVAVGMMGAGVFNAVGRGIPIKMAASSNVAMPGADSSGWVVRQDLVDTGKLKEIKDLKGMKIGVSSLASSSEIKTDYLLKAGGLTAKDIEYVVVPQADLVAALSNKALDVIVVPEPYLTIAEEKRVGTVWKLTGDVLPYYQTGGINLSPHLWQKDPEVAKAFLVAHLKASRDYVDSVGPKKKDRDTILKLQAKYTNEKDLNALSKVRPTGINPDGYNNVESISRDLEWYVAKGLVKPMKVTDLVDNSYAEYAVSVLGKYQP